MIVRLPPVHEPEDGTRLHFRISIGLPQTSLRAPIVVRIVLLMDQVMSTEMLRRLKLLIETYEERGNSGEANRLLAPHQGIPWWASENEAADQPKQASVS